MTIDSSIFLINDTQILVSKVELGYKRIFVFVVNIREKCGVLELNKSTCL